jgi:hypothetical protein
MKFEISSCFPYNIKDVLQGLLLLREDQAEPRIKYVKHKHEPNHIVHELQYRTHMLLVPFVGKEIVMREDMILDKDTFVVKTYGENYLQKKCPYMFTEVVYAANGTESTDCTLVVEWQVSTRNLGSMIETKLTNFGRQQHVEIQKRELTYIQKYVENNK